MDAIRHVYREMQRCPRRELGRGDERWYGPWHTRPGWNPMDQNRSRRDLVLHPPAERVWKEEEAEELPAQTGSIAVKWKN